MTGAVVVGAGLAGLACALRLHEEGLSVSVLEASDGTGGRVRTDRVDRFLLDRGFQVFLSAYPDAQRLLDYETLALRELYPGALVHADGRFHKVADPFRRPYDAVASLRSRVGTVRDVPRLARLRHRAQAGTVEGLLSRRETTAIEALRAAELSSGLVERFFRPFLGGIFLERELSTSSRMLDFVLRMLSLGYAALPADGMGAIPAQLAARLPGGSVRTGARVDAIQDRAVVLASGERVEVAATVVAADGTEAARLLGIPEPAWRSAACLYFAADAPPVTGPFLVLDGDGDGPVNHLCVPSEVAPTYAPDGRALVSASVLGSPPQSDEELEAAVRRQLAGWFGPAVESWAHLRTYRIAHAVPAREPPSLEPKDRAVRLRPGLYVCGDHRETASLQGALASGRRAAQAVIEDLGH